MGSFSVWHWLFVIVWFVVPMFPIGGILRKAGFSPWWALLYIVPIGNLIGLFVLANAKWPPRP